MSVSIAELDSRTFLGLEAAAEYLDLTQIHNAVVQKLNARTMQSRTSDTNVLIGKTDEFIPDVTPYDITALIGKGVPCWLETHNNESFGVDWWLPTRIINRSQLNNYQQLGIFAAAFYGDEAESDTAQATQYVAFTFLPGATCRIWFDRDLTRKGLTEDMLLPDHFADLIVMEAQNVIIPRLKLKLQMGLRRDAEGRKDAQGIMQTLSEIYAQNMMDIRPFHAEWEVWAFRGRDAQTSFNKPSPSGRSFYGDRYWWGAGGYGGGY